jgi:hypothetical protein
MLKVEEGTFDSCAPYRDNHPGKAESYFGLCCKQTYERVSSRSPRRLAREAGTDYKLLILMVAGGGIEPPTLGL